MEFLLGTSILESFSGTAKYCCRTCVEIAKVLVAEAKLSGILFRQNTFFAKNTCMGSITSMFFITCQ